MKTLILLATFAYLQLSHALMNVGEFGDIRLKNLKRCHDTNMVDNRRGYQKNINGQVLPLPNTIETFISLLEKYESSKPNEPTRDTVGKFLKSFRVDDLKLDEGDEDNMRDDAANLHNAMKRVIFSLPNTIDYEFDKDDFTEDEICALHFMLSHTINDTLRDANDVKLPPEELVAKHPRENGVVTLQSRKAHAFALGRVLLGIYAGLMSSNNEAGSVILARAKVTPQNYQSADINLVSAVTIGDLVYRMVTIKNNKVQGNGEWTDTSCPIEYELEDNNLGYVSNSEIRGAVDGLIIGRRLQDYRQDFSKFHLSQILRQYYGSFGLVDPSRTKSCERGTHFQSVQDIDNDMINFVSLYRAYSLNTGKIGDPTRRLINEAVAQIRNIVNDKDECPVTEMSQDRKYVSPRNIFAILDYTTAGDPKLNFQAEVIGNLSSDFDSRPFGNLMGVFTNIKAMQPNALDVIVKNSGIAGCPSCFAKHFVKNSGSKADEAELFKDLNDTLTTFDLEQEQLEGEYGREGKTASPGKIVLYFNFGNPNGRDNRVQEALWNLKQYYRGLTILAVGDNKDSLAPFVENDQMDIFSSSPKTIYDIKQRIKQVPAEFTYRHCNHSTPAKEVDNKQVAFIPLNKIQYWAMYPQYFLKSTSITMKFRTQEGTTIRVCFSRWYADILEGKTQNCKDSTGGEIEFWVNNPCHKRKVFNCDPFYFSVEGKKQPTEFCNDLRCSTPHDIRFEFEHQGISCNVASYVSISSLALLFAAFTFYTQRQ